MANNSAAVALPVPKWLQNRWGVWMRRSGLDRTWTAELWMFPTIGRGRVAALTTWPAGYGKATVSFSKSYYDGATERQMDEIINHEQHHLLTARVDDVLVDMVGNPSTVYAAYVREAEHCADHYALIMVRAYQRKRD